MTKSLFEDVKKTRKKSKVRAFLFVFLFLAFSTVIFMKYYIDNQREPVSSIDIQEKIMLVPKGSSSITIAKLLKDNNLIKNEYIFRLIAKMEKKDSKLKAGTYTLNNGMTPEEIINVLIKGGADRNTITFTIPEGYELSQIADKLGGQAIVDRERFLELSSDMSIFSKDYAFLKELPNNLTLEGYLYPDTYEVYTNATEEEIIRKMLDRFEYLFTTEIQEKAVSLSMDINQVITLASIIEREGKVDKERNLISAVFHNRLEKGMLLESCATIQFALGERKEKLTFKDLKIESQYNTYIHKGLPPGPIASPGIKSIIAAVNPADVDYLFFVSNGDGTHTFTKNFKDHIDAKNKN